MGSTGLAPLPCLSCFVLRCSPHPPPLCFSLLSGIHQTWSQLCPSTFLSLDAPRTPRYLYGSVLYLLPSYVVLKCQLFRDPTRTTLFRTTTRPANTHSTPLTRLFPVALVTFSPSPSAVGRHSPHPQIQTLTFQPSAPRNLTVFGNRALKEAIKVK